MSDKRNGKHQEILEKAIRKAIEHGWQDNGWLSFVNKTILGEGDSLEVSSLIFNHDFAKSLWGDFPTPIFSPADPNLATNNYFIPKWQSRLMQMVIAEDPIKYLGENM